MSRFLVLLITFLMSFSLLSCKNRVAAGLLSNMEQETLVGVEETKKAIETNAEIPTENTEVPITVTLTPIPEITAKPSVNTERPVLTPEPSVTEGSQMLFEPVDPSDSRDPNEGEIYNIP